MLKSAILLLTSLTLVTILGLNPALSKPPLLEPEEVRARIEKGYDKELGQLISVIDEQVKEVRNAILELFVSGKISKEVGENAHRDLMVADYYWTAAWVALVEGNNDLGYNALEIAQDHLNNALARIKDGYHEAGTPI